MGFTTQQHLDAGVVMKTEKDRIQGVYDTWITNQSEFNTRFMNQHENNIDFTSNLNANIEAREIATKTKHTEWFEMFHLNSNISTLKIENYRAVQSTNRSNELSRDNDFKSWQTSTSNLYVNYNIRFNEQHNNNIDFINTLNANIETREVATKTKHRDWLVMFHENSNISTQKIENYRTVQSTNRSNELSRDNDFKSWQTTSSNNQVNFENRFKIDTEATTNKILTTRNNIWSPIDPSVSGYTDPMGVAAHRTAFLHNNGDLSAETTNPS